MYLAYDIPQIIEFCSPTSIRKVAQGSFLPFLFPKLSHGRYKYSMSAKGGELESTESFLTDADLKKKTQHQKPQKQLRNYIPNLLC